MSETLLNIILKAVQIRLERGELLDIILLSYTKLTDNDKAFIRAAL